jgi:hypothetical protein
VVWKPCNPCVKVNNQLGSACTGMFIGALWTTSFVTSAVLDTYRSKPHLRFGITSIRANCTAYTCVWTLQEQQVTSQCASAR